MAAMNSTQLALRVIIAIFLERTAGRALIAFTCAFLLIALLAGINAYNGVELLWPIAGLTAGFALVCLVFCAATYALLFRAVPRRLNKAEKRFLVRYVKLLQKRLELGRTSLPEIVWQLLVQELMHEQYTAQQARVQSTIQQSPQLNQDFYIIQGYFETKDTAPGDYDK